MRQTIPRIICLTRELRKARKGGVLHPIDERANRVIATDNAPQTMTTIKPMAMILPRSETGKGSLKVRRKIAGWDHKYRRALFTRTAQ